jgi:glycosyltransferase involved in cell wall biosynthesis
MNSSPNTVRSSVSERSGTVSIIIPAYNAEPWIVECLRSALDQTWPACEILVIDDGSTDRTAAIAEQYVSPRLKLIRQANRGASAARNAGLKAASGEYIQFLDADDLLAPDKIEHQVNLLRLQDNNTLASGAWARFEHEYPKAHFSPFPNWRDLTGVEFLQLHYEEGCMMHPAAWLAPRSLLDRSGHWNETLSLNDDGEYFARVMLAATQIVFCPSARSYYRSNLSGSLSRRKDYAALDSLYRSVHLTLDKLLATDNSSRTRAAAAYAWKWAAFELYPGAPALSRSSMARSHALGGSSRPFPGSGRFQLLARIFGWRLARRITY